jgi:2-oxoisovalerate dehydrogenase E1 component
MCSKDRRPGPPEEGKRVGAALNEALHKLMDSDRSVLLLGQDLLDPYGGAFKVTAGLSTKHPRRVLATPISEAATLGAAMGLAVAGRKPIVEVMFADFLTLCADQLYNHAVKFPWVYREGSLPLVVRSPSGGRRGYGPTHSQSPEALFASMPGLTVVCVSHRHDVGELLESAVQSWPYPVLFLENKVLYGKIVERRDYIRAAEEEIFATMVRRRENPDVALIAWGGSVVEAEQAAAILEEEEEIAVSIIAPSLLSPLPIRALQEAVADAPRMVIVEEGPLPFGIGAEIVAALAERGYMGRVARVGAPPLPIPAARDLELEFLPSARDIVESVRGLFRS